MLAMLILDRMGGVDIIAPEHANRPVAEACAVGVLDGERQLDSRVGASVDA